MLDRWAQKVKVETERHLYRLTDPRYKDHAEHYKHSEARFRAEWLISVLQQDIGLHYHAGFVPQDVEVPPFKTSQETFLHGLMDNDDPHKAFGGNCVSLPVAYTAVGRRLGYPVKLVTSKEHVFCRWEGLDSLNPAWRDRFNFDGAGNGFSIDPDEFYLTWPRKSTPEQVGAAGWLKSLTPAQELALFIGTRGHVLVCVRKDYAKARGAYAHAVRLWPASRLPQMWLADAIAHVQPRRFRVEAASMMDDSPWPREVGANRNDQRPWYHTPQGRAANMAEVQRINEINRRKMERMRRLSAPRAPQTRTPYPVQRQQPGVRQPYQPPR